MTYDLTIERLIDAPPQAVFDSFVDPEVQKALYDNEVQMVPAAVPALVSYSHGQGNSATVSYPVAPDGPGTSGNGFPVQAGPAGDVVLTLTLWRPQRTPIPGEAGAVEWIDVGALSYSTELGNTPEVAPPWTSANKDCSQSAYSTTDPNMIPTSFHGPEAEAFGVTGGGFLDLAPDRATEPGNTYTYSVNVTRCLQAYGLSWEPGQERELLFTGTNLNDTAQLRVVFERL